MEHYYLARNSVMHFRHTYQKNSINKEGIHHHETTIQFLSQKDKLLLSLLTLIISPTKGGVHSPTSNNLKKIFVFSLSSSNTSHQTLSLHPTPPLQISLYQLLLPLEPQDSKKTKSLLKLIHFPSTAHIMSTHINSKVKMI